VFIQTFGCQMNEYDSAKILSLLQETMQIKKTDNVVEADLLLANTCSVRDKAYEKVYSMLGRWRKIKKNNPHVKIVVVGCVASQEGKNILRRAPFVDVITGPQSYHRIPKMLQERSIDKRVDVSFPAIEKFDCLPIDANNKSSAFVTIMEGCSKYCSFCIVPYTRGEEISRPFDDVLIECATLAKSGVTEIHFLGQNVNSYYGKMHDGEYADLALLIETVANIQEVKRVRFTTSHPIDFSDRLIECFANVKELVKFVHLPIQSGSDKILSLMKRGHTYLEYKSIIRKLRVACPEITISSDFIVGYPQEDEEDFIKTIKAIDEIGFDNSYSFIYSPRPGTPAADIYDNVPLEVKKRRLNILQDKIKKQAFSISSAMLGTEQMVLIEKFSQKSKNMLAGRCENNRMVNIRADEKYLHKFVKVKITKIFENSLQGKIVDV
jgi:tRNA-2-methylthio-N6-dimethylallyladenosine synthase